MSSMIIPTLLFTLIALLACIQVTAEWTEVTFEACSGVENLLGIQKLYISTKALYYGVIIGKIVHTPKVELDGPAFTKIDIADGALTFFKDFCNDPANMNGCPVAAGEENTLYPVVVSKKLMEVWDSLPGGTIVPVETNGYVFTGASPTTLARLGCINF